MAEFALIDEDNLIVRYLKADKKPFDPVGKKWKWLPVEEVKPNLDSKTHRLELDSEEISGGKVVRSFVATEKEVQRDFVAEFDTLKAKVAALEAKP